METRTMQLVALTFKTSKALTRPLMCFTFEDKHKKLFAYRLDTRDHRLRDHLVNGESDINTLQVDTARHLGMDFHDFRYANDVELCKAVIGKEFAVKWGYETYPPAGSESKVYPKVLSYMALQPTGRIELSYNYDESATCTENGTQTASVVDQKIRPLPTLIKSLISKGISAIFRKAN